jgi:hypothetical protein
MTTFQVKAQEFPQTASVKRDQGVHQTAQDHIEMNELTPLPRLQS